MTSNNRLLGRTYEDIADAADPVEVFAPKWLYHPTCPGGVIVKDSAKYAALTKEGWVDHPGKCILLAGHEKLFSGAAIDAEVGAETIETDEPEIGVLEADLDNVIPDEAEKVAETANDAEPAKDAKIKKVVDPKKAKVVKKLFSTDE